MRISKSLAGAASLIAIAAAFSFVQPSSAADFCATSNSGINNNLSYGNRFDDRVDHRFDDRFNSQFNNQFDNRYDNYFANRFDPRFGNQFNNSKRFYYSRLNQVRNTISSLQSKLENGRMQRRLSINEYNLYRDRLSAQSRKCDRMAQSGNSFDQREFDRMNDSLSKLDSLIASSLDSRPYQGAFDNGFGRRWF